LIINGLDVFHGGDRNNGTIISPTFLGGPVEIFAKTMVLSTFLGDRNNGTMVLSTFLGGTGTMEQWFYQLF
jgi:hypothetical protein